MDVGVTDIMLLRERQCGRV